MLRRLAVTFGLLVAILASGGAPAHARAAELPGAQPSSTPVHTGYRDFNFGTEVISTPTSEKPQSKLWWNDGVWWGCLWDPVAAAYRVHRMNLGTQTWQSVGPNADNRTDAIVDVLWDGARLYVLSHEFDSNGMFRLHSYTYDAGSQTYALRPGFPVDIHDGSTQSATIAKDTTGKLWITWEDDGDVLVNRSLSSETLWGTPFRLPVQGNDTSGDVSTITSFGGRIGVLWSNQGDHKVYFATHVDGQGDAIWEAREEALADSIGADIADDHLNIAVSGDGTVFAIAKTGLPNATDPRLFLLRRSLAGTWSSHVVALKEDDHTRPIVVLDDENRKIYVFAKSDQDVSGTIRVKSSDMDNIFFDSGPGEFFIRSDDDDDINNPTSTKQPLDGGMDLLVLASDEKTRSYLHNVIDLPGDGTPSPDIAVVPASGDYGSLLLGHGATLTFVVRNVGTLGLVVSATDLTGDDPEHFAIVTGGGAFALEPGASRDIVVLYTATTVGTVNATLRIQSNDPDEDPFDVALFAEGTLEADPDIAVIPAAYDFGSVPHGTTATHTFELRNEGADDLQVTSISLLDTGRGPFSIVSGAGSCTLAPGASREVIVRFNPGVMRTVHERHEIRDSADDMPGDPARSFKTQFAPALPGPSQATLRITSDDPDENPLDVALGGTGGATSPGTVLFEGSVGGGSEESISVSTSGDVMGGGTDLYLAAIASKKYKEVAEVTGMGLSWSRVLAQCGGRHQTGVEVWMASGSASTGPVTATMVEEPDGATIVVSRYSGADATLGTLVGANTFGIAGPCDDGVDGATYAVPTSTTVNQAVLFTAVALRDKELSVDAAWKRRAWVQGGSGGGLAGVVVMDRTIDSPGSVLLDGTLDEPEDWALIAVEIRPSFASKHEPSVSDPTQSARLTVSHGWGGRAPRIELVAPRGGTLHAAVFDVRGRLIRTLFEGAIPAGRSRLSWDDSGWGSELPTGVYFVRAALGGHVFTRRILRVR